MLVSNPFKNIIVVIYIVTAGLNLSGLLFGGGCACDMGIVSWFNLTEELVLATADSCGCWTKLMVFYGD